MAVLVACGVEPGRRHGRSSSCSYTKETCRWRRRKDNYAVLVPGSTTTLRRGTYLLDRSTGGIDFFELSIRKEANGPAVRRPKWKRGPFRSSHDLAGKSIERANIQHFSSGLTNYPNNKTCSVRRYGH